MSLSVWWTGRNATTWIHGGHHRLGVFADMDCPSTRRLLPQVSERVKIFNGSHVWLCWTTNENRIHYFRKIPLYLDSQITLALSTEHSGQVTLFDVYKAHPGRPLNLTLVGSWSSSSGLSISTSIRRRPNMEKIRLTVSMVLTDLEVDRNTLDEQVTDKSYRPEQDIVNRYFYVINDILREMCNYTWDIIVTDTWGYLQENGHFNGMIGTVENGTADYAMGPAEARADRQTVADFLMPIHGFRTCFVFRQPKVLGTYKALASPLDQKVWTYLLLIVLLASLSYKAIYKFRISPADENEDSFVSGLLLTVGVVCQQGLVMQQDRLSGRVFSLVLLFLALMTLAYYNAAIMNSLLSPSPNSIRSVDELVSSPFQLAMLNIPYLVSRINGNNPLAAAAYDKMMKDKEKGLVDSLEAGVANVRGSRYAFYAEDTIMYSEMDQTFRDVEKCDLSELEMLRPYPISSSLQKGSPFREVFNRNILLLIERGILYREDKVWYAQRPQCLGSQDILYVSLEAVSIAFCIIAVGFTFSSIIFILEILANVNYS